MTTPPVTSGRADTAMTDPRIALADRLRKHVSDRGGQFKDDEGNIVIPNGAWQMMIDAAGEIERLQAALRAIQPEELPDPKNVPASAHAGWDENGRRKFHPPYDKIAHILNAQSETWMREQTIEECARICDAAAKMHKHSRSGVIDQQWFEIKAEEAFQLSKSIRALSASKPGAVASAPVHPAPGVITMSDVRLIAGEGKLSASTVLQACNVIMKQRSALPLTDQVVPKETDFYSLHEANVARQKEWDPDNRITLAYRGNELAGEVGEACNVIKKLERERLGINGSRDTVEHLMEELADGVICSYLVAMQVDGNLDSAIVKKFNATSEKMGLRTRMLAAAPVRGRTG